MGQSRQLGMILMVGAALDMLIMTIGVMRRSYLVIALPVLALTAVISALTFWVGWTIANTDADLAELEASEGIPAVA